MWSYFIEIFYAGAHFHLGEIFNDLDRPKEARAEFEACLKLNPSHRKAKKRFLELC